MTNSTTFKTLGTDLEIIYFSDLTEAEQKEYDYCGDGGQFFRCNNETHFLGDFMSFNSQNQIQDFNGYHGTGYFTAGYFTVYLVKLSDCGECVETFAEMFS